MSTLTFTTMTTPAGPFTVLADADSVVHAAGFTDDPARLALMLPDADPTRPMPEHCWHPSVEKAVTKYFDGDLRAIDGVRVRYRPTGAFTAAAWQAMRAVEPGTTISYGELAEQAGNPTANRAAGAACAKNPIALFVPCHRIIRGDGSSHNYLYGLECKATLLAHEREHAGR